MADTEYFNRIYNEVISSKKYKNITEDLIKRLIEREINKPYTQKELVKSVKRKLHQVGNAFKTNISYQYFIEKLNNANNEDEIRNMCFEIMDYQSSTKERKVIINNFYDTIFVDIDKINSIMDLGCGLNPISIMWVNNYKDIDYYAFDIYSDMMDFLSFYFRTVNINGRCYTWDIISNIPDNNVDAVFLFKILPCIEQLEKGFSIKLLEQLNSKYMFISFPTKTIGGKNKDMANYYTKWFFNLISDKDWKTDSFNFINEIVFRVIKEC